MAATRASRRTPSASSGLVSPMPWSRVLDTRLTAMVADLLGQPSDDAWTPQNLLATCSRVTEQRGLPGQSGRSASTRQRLVCLTAVYGRMFRQTSPWRLADHDFDRGLLHWQHLDGTRILEMPRAIGATTPPRPGYLAQDTLEGLCQQPTPTLGIRILTLAAPTASRLLAADGSLHSLWEQ